MTTLADADPGPARAARAKVLFQISDGGGSFDVSFALLSGANRVREPSSTAATGSAGPSRAAAPRWTPRRSSVNLNLPVGTIDLSAAAGDAITAVTFGNSSNTAAASVAILAVNRRVGRPRQQLLHRRRRTRAARQGIMERVRLRSLVADNGVTLTASSLPPNQFGIFVSRAVSRASSPAPAGASNGNLCLVGLPLGRYAGAGRGPRRRAPRAGSSWPST